MEALIRHLHDFAREVKLTEAEWLDGVLFLTRTGHLSNAVRQEFILLSDTLGLSQLVVAQSHSRPKDVGDLPVAEVGTAHVLQILEPIWKAKAETASRVRGRMETILDAAKARGYREGENPARWRGHIAQILPARSRLTRGHHKAMPYEAIPAFVGALHKREAVAALALEFTILTAARTGEVIGAKWDEVNLDKAIWTIPASRMKAGKEHRVPLSLRAVEILKAMQGLRKEWLFPGTKGGKMSGMAMTMLLRRMKVDVTVHGFRSGFRDWSAECTGYAHEVAEMALAHIIESKVERAYRRGDLFDKRRRMMDDWASYCASDSAAIAR